MRRICFSLRVPLDVRSVQSRHRSKPEKKRLSWGPVPGCKAGAPRLAGCAQANGRPFKERTPFGRRLAPGLPGSHVTRLALLQRRTRKEKNQTCSLMLSPSVLKTLSSTPSATPALRPDSRMAGSAPPALSSLLQTSSISIPAREEPSILRPEILPAAGLWKNPQHAHDRKLAVQGGHQRGTKCSNQAMSGYMAESSG